MTANIPVYREYHAPGVAPLGITSIPIKPKRFNVGDRVVYLPETGNAVLTVIAVDRINNDQAPFWRVTAIDGGTKWVRASQKFFELADRFTV